MVPSRAHNFCRFSSCVKSPFFSECARRLSGVSRSRRDVQFLESSLIIINAVARSYKWPLIYMVLFLYRLLVQADKIQN